jgi:hypothetical protein
MSPQHTLRAVSGRLNPDRRSSIDCWWRCARRFAGSGREAPKGTSGCARRSPWSWWPRVSSRRSGSNRSTGPGTGRATAAGGRLVQLGFEEHNRHRIFATCDPRNVASAAVMRRLGMSYEGRMRETMLIRDGRRDSDLYSVLSHEWHMGPGTEPVG